MQDKPVEYPETVRDRMLLDDIHDRRLMDNCHPLSWSNPKPAGRYNLVVVGAGTAGLVSAAGAAGLGAKVALIERSLLGGDCLNVGCVPSKGVIRASRSGFDVRAGTAFGIRLGSQPTHDFARAMERMRRLRADISRNDSVSRFQGLGVDVYLGNARFTGSASVEVDGQRLEFDRAVVATGARAAAPAIPGLSEVGYFTNENIFTLTKLPERLVVVGAGPIGCELAQAFQRFGSQVTLVTHGSKIMPKEDPEAGEIVHGQFEREGMRVLYETEPVGAAQSGREKTLWVMRGGKREALRFDAILIGIGRRPNLEGLALEAAGIKFSPLGVEVDDRLRTSNFRIYAAGDVCSRYKFTHAADAMARIVLANALFFGRRKASALTMPRCTFTDPEVAHVGYDETEARDAGFDVATLTEPLSHVDRAVLDGENQGYARIHIDKKKGKLLGGTIVARHAGEMIGELTLAITTGQKAGVLASTIHPYPTQAEVLKRLGDQYMRQRLTPALKSLFIKWFAWKR